MKDQIKGKIRICFYFAFFLIDFLTGTFFFGVIQPTRTHKKKVFIQKKRQIYARYIHFSTLLTLKHAHKKFSD